MARVESEDTVTSEKQDKMVGEGVVLRMEEVTGGRMSKFFIKGEEIVFHPQKVLMEILPFGEKIEVCLGLGMWRQ